MLPEGESPPLVCHETPRGAKGSALRCRIGASIELEWITWPRARSARALREFRLGEPDCTSVGCTLCAASREHVHRHEGVGVHCARLGGGEGRGGEKRTLYGDDVDPKVDEVLGHDYRLKSKAQLSRPLEINIGDAY